MEVEWAQRQGAEPGSEPEDGFYEQVHGDGLGDLEGDDLLLVSGHFAPGEVIHKCLEHPGFDTFVYPPCIKDDLGFLSDILTI